MALKRNERYPGRFANPSTAHPQGAFQNRTSPTSQDGSYLEADWANDIDGFFARIINIAGITLNGTVDDGTASQLYDALVTAMPGRLLGAPKVFTSNGTYTPTAGTKKIFVEVQGAGGGGGLARATSSGFTSVGSGGGAGGYASSWLTTVPTTQAVVIGSGGSQGVDGGSSSFGSVSATGGGGGGNGTEQFADGTVRQFVGGVGGIGTGTTMTSRGGNGGIALVTTTGNLVGGEGGESWFSATDIPPAGNSAVGKSGTRGSGGTGAISGSSPSSAYAGGNGGNGVVIVWEYS